MLAPVVSPSITPATSSNVLTGLTALSSGLQAKPTIVLSLYSFGILMRRMTEDGGETEYAISPAQLSETLAVKVRFETGLLSGNTLCITQEGTAKVVVEYRPPQRTALYVDGSETPMTVPLPGLVMGRVSRGDGSLNYGVYAVKQRSDSFDTPLFNAPLPNTGGVGGICWGSVKRVSAEALASNRLDEDWTLLLGSVFTAHSVHGKSKRYRDDIRQQFIALEQRKASRYPVSDLVPAEQTLGHWLGRSK